MASALNQGFRFEDYDPRDIIAHPFWKESNAGSWSRGFVSELRRTYADNDEAIRALRLRRRLHISSLLVILTGTICSSPHLLLLPLEHLFSFTDSIFSLSFCVFFPFPPLLHSFNHSLSSFPHTSRPSASSWLSFIRPEPHFLQSAYSGRPFSLQMPAFVESKRLFKINFHDYLLCFFFPIPHSFMCILINSLCTSFSDKENRFSCSQKIGSRTYLYEQHRRQSGGALNNSLS